LAGAAPEIQDRDADVWEALIAVADLAGGTWPARARAAAVALVAEAKDTEPSLGVRLLADLRTVFGSADELSSKVGGQIEKAIRKELPGAYECREYLRDLTARTLDRDRFVQTIDPTGFPPHI
jgi:hypothetical protein